MLYPRIDRHVFLKTATSQQFTEFQPPHIALFFVGMAGIGGAKTEGLTRGTDSFEPSTTREIRDRLMQHTNKADLALLWPPKITNVLFSGWPS